MKGRQGMKRRESWALNGRIVTADQSATGRAWEIQEKIANVPTRNKAANTRTGKTTQTRKPMKRELRPTLRTSRESWSYRNKPMNIPAKGTRRESPYQPQRKEVTKFAASEGLSTGTAGTGEGLVLN